MPLDFAPTVERPIVWTRWLPPPANAPASVLNQTAGDTAARQETVAGEGSLIPLVYGTQRVGAKIAAALTYQGNLVLLAVWCLGEVDAVSTVEIDDLPLVSGVTVTHHRGTSTQTADSTMVAAYAARGKFYSDTLRGICYSVFKIPPATSTGFPRLTALIRGMKIATTSGGSKSYQDNPAYIVADFIENTVYGMGRTVDWSTIATLATACDTTVGGERKRILNLVLDQAQTGETWLQVLRDYAGAWVVPEGSSYRAVADSTGSSVMSFNSSNIVEKSLRLDKRGTRNAPTVVWVEYTDTSQSPWRADKLAAYAPGVLAGTTPRRVSTVQKPGLTRYSEANRYAIERLNDAILNDLTAQFMAFDPALELQVGEIIDVTHPIGLTAKLFRAMKIDPDSPGRWRITAVEYDPAKYSSVVVSGPSVDDTDWPSPSTPPTPGPLTLTEEVYQVANGTYASRIRATWATVDWPFVSRYRITVTTGGAVIDTRSLERDATSYATPAIQEGIQYDVALQIISTTIAIGEASVATITADGKTAIPGDVSSLTGFEAGGRVFLYWSQAVDLDIWRYELRYGSTGGSWDTATLIDRVDSLTYQAVGIAAGTWRFYVKAIDSIGQYSVNPATIDLEVTLDAAAFLLGTRAFDELGSPTLTNMTAFSVRPNVSYYVTDFGDGLGYGADNTNNSVGTFGDSLVNVPFASPHTAGTSTYLTQTWDLGLLTTGNFSGSIVYTDLVGTATLYLETSPDNSSWTQWAGGSTKTTDRYVRIRLQTTGAMLVEAGATARVDAYPREETGTKTCGSSGPSTVTLALKYAKAKSIQLTPTGTTAKQAVYDNVVLSTSGTNSFDVYLFNAAGTQIAGDVSYLFQGI